MLTQNESEFIKSNIKLWLDNDYTGKGSTVVVLDDSSSPRPKDNVETPLNDSFDRTGQAGHKKNVCGVVREVTPNARIMAFNWFGGDKDKITDWITEHKDEIDVINCSFSSTMTSSRTNLERIKELNIPVICSSGNEENTNKLIEPARYDWTIAIGAFEEKSDRVAYYSNGSDSLDAVAFTNIYIPTESSVGYKIFDGTSCSAPVVCGMLAIYFEYRRKHNLSKMTSEEVRKFIQLNTRDLYDIGRDLKSGYGLFKLPPEIPVIEQPKPPIVIPTEPVKEEPKITDKYIIDISHHQDPSKINYELLSKNVSLAIIRTQYGSSTLDRHYKTHHAEFKKYGVPTASYAWVRGSSVDDMRKEATDFYNRTKDLNPTFWFLDVEEKSMNDMRIGVSAYVKKLRELGAKKVGVYIAHHLYKTFNLDLTEFDAVWIPHYGVNNGNVNSKPVYQCDIHQFTSVGRLNGYDGNLDLNRLIGSKPVSYFTNEGEDKPVEQKPIEVKPTAPEKASDWAKDGWEWVFQQGIMDGTRPLQGLTREEFATVLYRLYINKLLG